MRFIPAYAGSTSVQTGKMAVSQVHPRIRGVHLLLFEVITWKPGSSPHTRGPLLMTNPFIAGPRFIPAYAGSTLEIINGIGKNKVHPRIRGVHLMFFFRRQRRMGSSPHTRGPPRRVDREEDLLRFIPAYAGSTVFNLLFQAGPEVHPRIRGVHLVPSDQTRSSKGSSPHTRGPLQDAGFKQALIWFIPAYAGSTLNPVVTLLLL